MNFKPNKRVLFRVSWFLSLFFLSNNLTISAITSLQLIEDAYKSGKITKENELVMKLQTIFSPEKLSTKYKGEKDVIKCLTPLLSEIRDSWDILSENTKKDFELLFLRPTDSTYYVPKVNPTVNFAYTIPEAVPYDTSQGNFRIHFVTSTIDAPDLTDLNGNNIPDYVETVGNTFECIFN